MNGPLSSSETLAPKVSAPEASVVVLPLGEKERSLDLIKQTIDKSAAELAKIVNLPTKVKDGLVESIIKHQKSWREFRRNQGEVSKKLLSESMRRGKGENWGQGVALEEATAIQGIKQEEQAWSQEYDVWKTETNQVRLRKEELPLYRRAKSQSENTLEVATGFVENHAEITAEYGETKEKVDALVAQRELRDLSFLPERAARAA